MRSHSIPHHLVGAAAAVHLGEVHVVENVLTEVEQIDRRAAVTAGSIERFMQRITPVTANVHIMVTTTDSGNVLCDPYYRPGRSAEEGAPISDSCTDRLDRFESISVPPINAEQACTNVCPMPLAPEGDYISFAGSLDNVPDVPPADIDGDGVDDSPVAQTLSCVGPQGIDGCGYESQLESMMQALDPAAPWNSGNDPFLRPGSLLAVAMITDEADCSVVDDSVMMDTAFQEDDPTSNMAVPSSAICWNAGVSCDGPDADGAYTNCQSTGESLRPVQEYIDFLRGQEGRRVVMLGILGIPIVTERNPEAPYQPIAGGVQDLVYRDWRDPEYGNGGDILPDEWAQGIDAAYKQFQFGIGPGCTGQDEAGNFTGQAIPPVRIREVCEALDVADDPDTPEDETEIRCCLESICDTDFSFALRCLAGLVEENFVPTE
jgi:hypothetical protein